MQRIRNQSPKDLSLKNNSQAVEASFSCSAMGNCTELVVDAAETSPPCCIVDVVLDRLTPSASLPPPGIAFTSTTSQFGLLQLCDIEMRQEARLTEVASMRRDWRIRRLPTTQIIFRIIQDVSSFFSLVESCMGIARYNWCIID